MILNILKYVATNKYVMVATLVAFSTISFIAYYKYTSFKIDNLNKEVAELQTSVEQKTAYIESLKNDYAKILKSREDLEDLNRKYVRSIKSLNDKLNREAMGKKSISELANKKPNLIEKFINSEIKRQLDCIRNIESDKNC